MNDEKQNSHRSNQLFEESIDLKALTSILYANKKVILLVIAICLFFSTFYIIVKPLSYTANVLLQVEDHGGSLGGLGTLSSSMARSSAAPAEVQTVLIKSRYILEPVVESLGLNVDVHPYYFPIIGRWYARYHSADLARPFLGMSTYAWGGETLKLGYFSVPATEEKKQYILVAGANNTYQLLDAAKHFILAGQVGEIVRVNIPGKGEFCFQVAELKANPNVRFYLFKKTMQTIVSNIAAHLQIIDLGQAGLYSKSGVLQISTVGANPDDIVALLNTIAKMTVSKDIEKKSAESVKTLDFLNQQLPQVKQSLDQSEMLLNQYRAKTGKIDLDTESKLLFTQISEGQKQLEEVRIDRAAALQKFTPLHPYILTLNDKEQALEAESRVLQLQVSKLPASDQVAVSLMRDVRVKSQLYLLLLNKIQSLRVTKASTISDVRILDLANFPDAPVPVPRLLICFISLVFGLFLGIVMVLIRNALHKKIIDPTQIEQQFGLSNMAIVPYSEAQAEIIATHNPKITLLPLLAQTKPKDLSMEALRSLRTSLKFAMMDAVNNVITIMGVSPAVGKSFVSANFAYLMADTGKKILLIDGDIRKGHLKNYFKLGACKGLSEVIAGNYSFEQALIKTSLPTLDFLASGVYPPNPSELLMSSRFKELIDRVSQEYDLVIIDTAPILAVTDGLVIAHHAATNFIVLASGVHEADEIQVALKRVSANNVNLAGAIFNFSKLQTGLYRAAGNYGYNYQYKYE